MKHSIVLALMVSLFHVSYSSAEITFEKEELFDKLTEAANKIQACLDEAETDAPCSAIIDQALSYAFDLIDLNENYGLALIGSKIEISSEKNTQGLIEYLFSYCSRKQNNNPHMAQKLSFAASLEASAYDNSDYSPLEEWEKENPSSKNAVEKIKFAQPPAYEKEFFKKIVRVINSIFEISNNELFLPTLQKCSALFARLNTIKKLMKETQEHYLVKWAAEPIIEQTKKLLQEQLALLPAAQARVFQQQAKQEGIPLYVSEASPQKRFLTWLLGVGILGGAAFIIAYYLGYRPARLTQKHLESLPGWNKVQQIIPTIINRWKTFGVSITVLKGLRMLNNYYKFTVAPSLEKKSRDNTRSMRWARRNS